ncbi:MAG: PilZ domain-containing protein [Bryobacteraceae bacterium]|nr:PilZ domain-containing protein [Bryobacteraceae bacterium]
MNVADQRRSKRFELHLPLKLLRAGARQVNEVGETRNLSSGGVLFTSDQEIQVGDPVEYIITLPSKTGEKEKVRLHCVGKVIRLDKVRGESSAKRLRSVAVTLERYEFVRSTR